MIKCLTYKHRLRIICEIRWGNNFFWPAWYPTAGHWRFLFLPNLPGFCHISLAMPTWPGRANHAKLSESLATRAVVYGDGDDLPHASSEWQSLPISRSAFTRGVQHTPTLAWLYFLPHPLLELWSVTWCFYHDLLRLTPIMLRTIAH